MRMQMCDDVVEGANEEGGLHLHVERQLDLGVGQEFRRDGRHPGRNQDTHRGGGGARRGGVLHTHINHHS